MRIKARRTGHEARGCVWERTVVTEERGFT